LQPFKKHFVIDEKSTMKIRARIIFLTLVFISNISFSQSVTQTVKGKVYDNETQAPLTGAFIVIKGTDPLMGITTDILGNFKIANVPLGRYNIQISYLGYELAIVPEILVTSGREVVINTGLKQSVTQMDEVTVKAFSHKDQPVNTMASVSAKSFTVEEARRYAGGVDDPARLASAFAGVTVGNLQDNAIIIRGNSPKGVSWRLEGVEIPNPNHFSGGNVAGGGFVTIFSSQLLANSDFFTGAFPAEYGNALAGVFDMKLRNGNADNREYTLQAGILGIDISSEGPFKKGNGATYLFNYRYSTFGLLTKMGIIPSEQIPVYQDLSFKLNFPTQKAGVFSLWGIGAIDNNNEPDEIDSAKWETDWDRIKYTWNLNTGALGLTHKFIIGKQTFISTTFAASGIHNKMDATRLDSNLIRRPNWYFTDNSGKITLSTFVNHKFSARHTVKTGVNYHTLFYSLDLNSTINNNPETFQNFVNEDGHSNFSEFYIQSKFDINESLSVFSGINANYFALNNKFSIDPRASIKWRINQQNSLSFGYGKHSQLEELKIYLINKNVNGITEYPNKNLELSKAQHFILAYDWLINENLRFKIESYYQYLYDIPGIPDSSFSLINFKQDWSFRESLENNSKGRNIGIDFTFERFLNHNYYYLVTASVFDSKYKGDDGVWRNSRYDKGFVVNLLFGKEFFMNNNRVLGVNTRLNYMGGERTSPVMMNESLRQKTVIYNESKAFEDQLPSMYYLDFTITYRTNKKKYSGVWALQLKNALGSPMYEGYSYNYLTDKIQSDETVVVIPVISYKIEF
jgi:hypothetical protein